MTKPKNIPSSLFVVAAVAIVISGCTLRSEEPIKSGPQAKATYQIIATTANKNVDIQDIKPILDYRARLNKLIGFQSEIVDNKLTATADSAQFTREAAKKLTEINQLSIGEKRNSFTAEEIARKKTYNEGQKDSLNRGYAEAQENPADFDSIVTTYSENTDLTNKSIHNFQRKVGMQKEIADTLFSTGTGSITDLVSTPEMVWFAKVLDRQEQEEITAQHILISYIGSKAKNPYLHRTKSQAEKYVNEIKDSITAKNFAEKAKEISDDSSNSGKGGSLGAFPHGVMARAFEDAAFSAELNQVIGPIATEFGWHFILVTKKETIPFVMYQDVVRFLKPLTPQSGFVPVLHIGNEIKDIQAQVKSTPVEETTGSGSITEEKDYRLVITFSREGIDMLLDFANTHKDLNNLAFMLDDAPYWKLTADDQISSDGTIILQGDLTEEQVRKFTAEMKSYSLPTGIQLIDYQIINNQKSE